VIADVDELAHVIELLLELFDIYSSHYFSHGSSLPFQRRAGIRMFTEPDSHHIYQQMPVAVLPRRLRLFIIFWFNQSCNA